MDSRHQRPCQVARVLFWKIKVENTESRFVLCLTGQPECPGASLGVKRRP